MSNKKIEINPALFSVGGLSKTKTKKNRDKITKPTPLISPNILKNKLLNQTMIFLLRSSICLKFSIFKKNKTIV